MNSRFDIRHNKISDQYSKILSSRSSIGQCQNPKKPRVNIRSFNSFISINKTIQMNPDEVQIRKKFNHQIKNLKAHLCIRKQVCNNDLLLRTSLIKENEKSIYYLSRKRSSQWRYLQKRVSVLSMLKHSITKVRRFGINSVVELIFHQGQNPKRRNKYLLDPEHLLFRMHVYALLTVILLEVAFAPLYMVFDNEALSFIDHMAAVYFVVDIILCCNTPSTDRDGAMLEDRRSIVKNYAVRHFWFDLLSVFPFEHVYNARTLMFKRLLKVPRILRLFNSMFQNTESKKQTRNLIALKLKNLFPTGSTYAIVQSLLFTLAFIHISACFWCLIHSVQSRSWLTR